MYQLPAKVKALSYHVHPVTKVYDIAANNIRIIAEEFFVNKLNGFPCNEYEGEGMVINIIEYAHSKLNEATMKEFPSK